MSDPKTSKPGFDEGYPERDQMPAPLPGTPTSEGVRRGQEYHVRPPFADVAHWEDPCNYDPGIANILPMDGVSSTAYKLCQLEDGISVDNVMTKNWRRKMEGVS